MHPRIKFAKLVIKIGRWLQSSAVVIMRPNDLIEFSRRHYLNPDTIKGWGSAQLINSGLSPLEQNFLNKVSMSKGRLLLLGMGGGREAIPLARMGFEVTGIDFVPGMVEQAMRNANKNGVKIAGLIQDISKLDLPESAFDVVWLSAAMYSCVPTRKKRVDMLRKINKSLRPGGYFAFGFIWNPKVDASAKSVFVKKSIAWLTLGNLHYEKGDTLRFNAEFIHAFTSLEVLKAEIDQSGFELIDIQANDENEFAGAIAIKLIKPIIGN